MHFGSILSFVENDGRCAIACQEDYLPFHLGLRQQHRCVQDEWKNQDSIDMVCQYNSK